MKFDISKLFGSKCRTKILERFFLSYSSGDASGHHMRGLARDLDEQINSIKREIDNLEKIGILKHRKESRKKIFYINPNFPLIEEFEQIFLKSFDPIPSVKSYLRASPLLELAVIHESLRLKLTENSKNPLDIFLIGEIDKNDFMQFIENTFYGSKIKYAIISTEDFFKKIEYGDQLIKNILLTQGNIFVKDNLNIKEKYLKI